MSAPRGRCPECGKDWAITPSGKVWRHRRWNQRYDEYCGEGASPMTAAQCERWDEFERAAQAELHAQWRIREQQQREAAERAAQQQLAETRLAFRSFSDESFAACPWRSDRVAFIAIAADGPVTFACHAAGKQDMLKSEYMILVAWPGKWSQHVFLLSGQDKLAVLAAM